MPFIPHISCECLSKIEGKNFYSKIKWPGIEKSLLTDENIVIVVQINGKKEVLFQQRKIFLKLRL